MADRLTAAQFAAFSGHALRSKIVRTATVDNAAIASTDITSRVKLWGEIDFQVFNRHPTERGSLKFPVLALTVDNSRGYFSRGGVIFPNGNADFASTVIHVSITIGGVSFFVFDGRILQPEYSNEKTIDLVAEFPLSVMTSRNWTRDDRIGGKTGVQMYFVS